MNNKKQKTNFLIAVIIALIGVGIGITAFIFGTLTLKNKGGSPLTMGTDLVFGTSNSYNTLSYTAMAYTANNLERVNLTLRVIKDALAYLLIIFGLLIVLLSIYKFIKYIQKQLVATSISEINNSEINNNDNTSKELEVYMQLLKSGTITEDDYNAKKNELLNL